MSTYTTNPASTKSGATTTQSAQVPATHVHSLTDDADAIVTSCCGILRTKRIHLVVYTYPAETQVACSDPHNIIDFRHLQRAGHAELYWPGR